MWGGGNGGGEAEEAGVGGPPNANASSKCHCLEEGWRGREGGLIKDQFQCTQTIP